MWRWRLGNVIPAGVLCFGLELGLFVQQAEGIIKGDGERLIDLDRTLRFTRKRDLGKYIGVVQWRIHEKYLGGLNI